LARGGERDLAGGGLLAGADDPHHRSADTLNRDLKRLQYAGSEALFFAQQPEQDVLGADVVVLERPRLLLGQDDHLAGAFCESFKQISKNRSAYKPTQRDGRCTMRSGLDGRLSGRRVTFTLRPLLAPVIESRKGLKT
jgi:hypothetical protein